MKLTINEKIRLGEACGLAWSGKALDDKAEFIGDDKSWTLFDKILKVVNKIK